jgi:hypothetical protein
MKLDKRLVSAAPLGAMVSFLLAMSGCGSPADQQGGGTMLPFIQIQSAIADGTSDAGQGPFPVSFYGAGRPLDDTTLPGLLARLEIQTWPEGTLVPTTSALDPPSVANTETAEVSVGEPLTGRWYSLQFGPSAEGLMSEQTFDNGVWGVRLRPDSHPAVTLLEFCQTSMNTVGLKFIVTFSEPVTVDDAMAALTVQQNGASLSCRLDSVGANDVHQFCDELASGPANVTLADGTVQGPDGAFLPPQLWTVDIATLPGVESGCKGYRVPL